MCAHAACSVAAGRACWGGLRGSLRKKARPCASLRLSGVRRCCSMSRCKPAGDRRRATHFAQRQHLDFILPALCLHSDRVARVNFSCGFGRRSVPLHTAELAGARGERPRLEEARCPQPFVNPNAGHLCFLPEELSVRAPHVVGIQRGRVRRFAALVRAQRNARNRPGQRAGSGYQRRVCETRSGQIGAEGGEIRRHEFSLSKCRRSSQALKSVTTSGQTTEPAASYTAA